VGRIGQDQGSLFTPFDFTLLPGGRSAILDNEGRNLEVFSEQGRSERRISLPGVANSLAADSSGHVLVSLPGRDNFIKVIGEDGRLLRSFGPRRRFSDFYGRDIADRDGRFGPWINRCEIAVDPLDNVHVAFEAAPVVQKYDSRGKLLFERQIEGAEVAKIIEGVRIKKKSPVVHGYWGDGLSLPYIVTGISFDRLNNELIVLLLWDRMWIKRIGASGHVKETLEIADHHLLLQKPFADTQNGRILFATLSSKLEIIKMRRILLPAVLAAFTILNIAWAAPRIASACSCPLVGCVGQCCGGNPCSCYDIGTDNCKAAQ
jgi:hypothetical protein